jgi:hypothetical protein
MYVYICVCRRCRLSPPSISVQSKIKKVWGEGYTASTLLYYIIHRRHPFILYHTPPTPLCTISYTADTLIIYQYLDSLLLPTFYTLSFIDYIHDATHLLTHSPYSPYSRYSIYSRYSRYSLTSTYSTYNICIYIYVYIYMYVYIYTHMYIYVYNTYMYRSGHGGVRDFPLQPDLGAVPVHGHLHALDHDRCQNSPRIIIIIVNKPYTAACA